MTDPARGRFDDEQARNPIPREPGPVGADDEVDEELSDEATDAEDSPVDEEGLADRDDEDEAESGDEDEEEGPRRDRRAA